MNSWRPTGKFVAYCAMVALMMFFLYVAWLANRPLFALDVSAHEDFETGRTVHAGGTAADFGADSQSQSLHFGVQIDGGTAREVLLTAEFGGLAGGLRDKGIRVCELSADWEIPRGCGRGRFAMLVDMSPEHRRLSLPSGCVVGASVSEGRADFEFGASIVRGFRRDWLAVQYSPTWAASSSNVVYAIDRDFNAQAVFCDPDEARGNIMNIVDRCLRLLERPLPTMPMPGWGDYSDCRFGEHAVNWETWLAPRLLALLRFEVRGK